MKILGSDSGSYKKDKVGGLDKSDKAKVASTSSEAKNSESSSANSGEKVAVSNLGKEIARISEQVKASPDIRIEKVQELKSQIEEGTYSVSADEIAGSIINDILNQGK